ncbi:MAG: hypothetical protein RIK87_13575 [Fuerstiella sp.]
MASQEIHTSKRLQKYIAESITNGAKLLPKSIRLGKSVIRRESIACVGLLVHQQKIGAYYAPKPLPGNAAAFYVGNNNIPDGGNSIVISAQAAKANPIEVRGALIHEAVHAVNDLIGRSIGELEDEALAHVAESIYHISRNARIQKEPYKTARIAALEVLSDGKVSQAVYLELKKVLHNGGKGYQKRFRHYDGVPGTTAETRKNFHREMKNSTKHLGGK